MREELKPCPFCGSSKVLVLPRTCDKDTPYNPADRAFPVVRCCSCGADAAGDDWKGPETAIVKWNRRASSPVAADTWQPIATAPKDGAWIVAIGHLSNGTPDTLRWRDGHWWNGCDTYQHEPTHWQPLPPPPAAITEGKPDA